jgi:membrane protease YdiL (CAAX protease family)
MAAGDAVEITMLVSRVVIGAAVWEEVVFRGLLFAGLARRWGFWPGAIVSSLAFSAIHAAPGAGSFVYLGAQAMVFGLIAAWLVRHTGRLWPAIVFHAANNAVGVFLFVVLA